MPATPVWLAAAESVLNRSIGGSIQASAAARRLSGTAIVIGVEGFPEIRAAVSVERLALTAGGDPAAEATISGSALAFLGLLGGGPADAGPGPGGRVRPGAIRISGDAEVAGRYRDLFALARPDLEEELARLVGDLPARRLSLMASAAASWAHRLRRTAGENLVEYLQEESRDLVNKPELEEFLAGVDHLRETADRVEARLERVEQRLKGAT